jgi:dynein light intermediate chain
MGAPRGVDAGAVKTYDAAAFDAADAKPTHMAVSRLIIGTWNLVAKHDEHILLSFYWAERKLVWEVLHLGVVRKMEADFEDVTGTALHPAASVEESERLVLELARPPRFYREAPSASADAPGAQTANYVYTTDFTNGQASQVSRHVLHFPFGTVSAHVGMMKRAGLPLWADGTSALPGQGAEQGRQAGAHSMSARLRQPPTSSPRLDTIILQEQLEREMRECQARYTGICPIRERLYAAALDELTVAISRDEPKRGGLLRRLTAEMRMSTDAYRTVYEKSLLFGSSKLCTVSATHGDLPDRITDLETEITGLQARVRKLGELCESLAHREEQKAKGYEVEPPDVTDLKSEQKQLQSLLEVLRLSKPERVKQ